MDPQSGLLFLSGLGIGLSIAAPVGAMGALCVSRTLTVGRAAGLVYSLGPSSAGAFYSAVGGFQLTLISSSSPVWETWLRGLGGLVMCYLGILTFLSVTRFRISWLGKAGYIGIFILTFLLTLASPLTVVPFTAIFPGFWLDRVI